MTDVTDAYLDAAASAATLLAEPAVAAAWDKPSALAKFSVGGLAGHLAFQILNVEPVLTGSPPNEPPIALLDHYASVRWVHVDLDDEINVSIRRSGEERAAGGPDELAATVAASVARLRTLLAATPGDRAVHLPWTGWALTIDDFLTTRMLEITVHSDDLAVSVGIGAPELPSRVLDPVLALLTRLAVRRHGQTAVVRALSRAERAPATIAAI
ncbi:maleylpyruvate isomerase N-terminal domain-containing protein [Micromonospora sp. CPCC 206061]|uniref:maleylpyruvate isomerase N-terminal domain-containing protein n=1 Tax=Micromonospora sp. CPCC 206061 TaxID=3122410 RepID=UPI002FF298C8